MIAVIGFGLVFLAGRRRAVARDRRTAWEQRRRAELIALTRDRHPDS